MEPVTIHINTDRAEQILMDKGWRVVRTSDQKCYYVRPDGENHLKGGVAGIDFLWQLDEALTEALEAEKQPHEVEEDEDNVRIGESDPHDPELIYHGNGEWRREPVPTAGAMHTSDGLRA